MFGCMNFSQVGDMNLIHKFSQNSEEKDAESIEVHRSVELIPTSGSLYLGNILAAKDVLKLKKKQIKFVLTALPEEEAKFDYYDRDKITQIVIPCEDCAGQNMMQHLETAIDFIDKSLKEGNVLVHCFAGVSRSSTLVISYLMYKNAWSFSKTLKFV